MAAGAALLAHAQAECEAASDGARHHTIAANADTVHWGYFSKERAPQAYVRSGDFLAVASGGGSGCNH